MQRRSLELFNRLKTGSDELKIFFAISDLQNTLEKLTQKPTSRKKLVDEIFGFQKRKKTRQQLAREDETERTRRSSFSEL